MLLKWTKIVNAAALAGLLLIGVAVFAFEPKPMSNGLPTVAVFSLTGN